MKKQQPSKPNAQKANAPAMTLHAGSSGLSKAPPVGIDSTPRPPEWARYVDSRMKQFCMR
jgi:hypothetical protein